MLKRVFGVTLLVVISFFLIACDDTEQEDNSYVVLPDLNGMVETDIIEMLDGLDITYEIDYHDTQSETYEHQFIMYVDYNIGDIVTLTELVTVVIYPEYVSDTIITLPTIDGLRKDDIIEELQGTGIVYYFDEVETEDEQLDGIFLGYVDGLQAGDEFDNISAIGIQVYDYVQPMSSEYFEPVVLVYDGPYLDQSLIGTEYMNPRGGAFDVTLLSCTDGDTSRFHYPSDIYNAINSSAKSTRFLNMDTEETYYGGEEEWGKPASLYTCSLLESAEAIALQTDPGDSLLGTHGRLLAWIWIQLPGETEYQLLNYMVVRQGLAQVKYEFGAGETLMAGEHTLNEWMHIGEDAAIEEQLGQWGNKLDYYWNYDAEEPYYDRWNNAS